MNVGPKGQILSVIQIPHYYLYDKFIGPVRICAHLSRHTYLTKSFLSNSNRDETIVLAVDKTSSKTNEIST